MNPKLESFRNRLQKVYRHSSRQAKGQKVSCFRIYDHDLPEYPVCIEQYDQFIYVAEYKRRHNLDDEAHDLWLTETQEVISAVTGINVDNIFIKLRQRKAGRQGQYQRLDGANHEHIVEENELKFIINLQDFLDTGLFLDHRVTRQMVRSKSQQKDVLNLFAYTGSFSVYAAAGGASSVTTIDMSNTYLQWAERNLVLNGYDDKDRYKYIQADVLSWLKTAPTAHFDLIVLDPPTFSNSKRMNDFLDVQRDHVWMINECLRMLKDNGELYFSTNMRNFTLNQDEIKAASFRDITRATTPFDFQGKLFRYCFHFTK